jgi:GntP family gluconate:H+ symporter
MDVTLDVGHATKVEAEQVWYEWKSSQEVTLHSSDFLVPTTVVDQARNHPLQNIGSDLTAGFTESFRKLGIPVTMAAIVGVCLIESGAALRLVLAIAGLFGPRGTAPALTVSGFLLGVPVFFENVFYLLLPLAKAIGRTRPTFYLTAVMAIIVGATMAHSLVPPTPGPLLVCKELNVSISAMMVGGFVVGGIASSCGFVYGLFCRNWVQLSPEQTDALEPAEATSDSESKPPRIPLVLATLPIAIPVIAFASSSFAEANPGLVFLGAAILSILLMRRYSETKNTSQPIAKGLADAGIIVLITSAGGAFGASLQQLQLADAIASNFKDFQTPWGLLISAWFLTAIIRAAQGSATVAMITTAGIVSPVMSEIVLPYHPVYLALAIGCGSKPFPWLNDSGFWQVSTMTGMNVSQTLKTFSAALTIMGTIGFLATLLGAWLLPLV